MTRDVRPIGRARLPERLLRWSVALPMTALRYVTQRVPLHRRVHQDLTASDAPLPDLEGDVPGDTGGLQRASEGVGALFHRSFTVSMTDEQLDAEQLIDHVLEDPNRVAPSRMARFETFDGRFARDLEVGDELVVRLPGPWDGPVRLIQRTPTSFRLATMEGHMEAGEIEFSTGYDDRGYLLFRIDSWARSGDRLFHLLYERFPLGREMQLHMWSQFCQKAASASGGVRMSNVTVVTRRLT